MPSSKLQVGETEDGRIALIYDAGEIISLHEDPNKAAEEWRRVGLQPEWLLVCPSPDDFHGYAEMLAICQIEESRRVELEALCLRTV